MKYVITVGAILTALAAQLTTAVADIEALIESCNDSVQGMTEDHKARYRANEYPDDPVTHCFVRCIGMTLNLYDDKEGADLHANWERLGKTVDEAEFVAMRRACLDERNVEMIEDPCDRAYGAFQCLKEDYGMDRIPNETNR
uniref:Uncharacterized protein n=1 Tax=Anopheles farauti TaxID=69004 RepID=A0A182Q2G8_9DIPT